MTDEPVALNRAQERAAGHTGGKRIYKLTFDDPALANPDGDEPLIVRAKAVSFRKLLDLARIDTSVLSRPVAELDAAEVDLLMGLLEDFAGCIVSWNVVDEATGAALEPSVDALLDQDPGWVLQVFMAWFQAIASVPAPLASRSPSGGQFPGGSVPMAPPSASPPS